jgi:hypothetical protein
MNRAPPGDDHWLRRPRTIRRLWVSFAITLALTVLAQAVIAIKPVSHFDGWPGFAAAFGFLCCLALVSIGRSKPTPPSRCRARRTGRPPLPVEPARQPSTSRL